MIGENIPHRDDQALLCAESLSETAAALSKAKSLLDREDLPEIDRAAIERRFQELSEDDVLLGAGQLEEARMTAMKLGWGLSADAELPPHNLFRDEILDSVIDVKHSGDRMYDLMSGTYTMPREFLEYLLYQDYIDAGASKALGISLNRSGE
jgi:hypothetical protein